MIIKQHKGVIMISGKRYNTYNSHELEIFMLFTGVTEPFIQSIPYGLNLHYSYWV